MLDHPIDDAVLLRRSNLTKVNRGLIFAFVSVVFLACAVAAVLLLLNAYAERESIRDQALKSAATLSFGFDQEVAAVNYLLKGLSTSPALQAGDIKAFHAQLRATQVPEGSWLILQDFEGQVANTLRDYGEPLPRRADMPNYDALIARLQARPWTVSGRLVSALKGGFIVGLSLRIDGPDGRMKSWLTTILAQPRLHALLDVKAVPPGWQRTLYDRDLNAIVSSDKTERVLTERAPEVLRRALANVELNSSAEGLFDGIDGAGTPILVSYRRSESTNWAVVVTVPMTQVNGPINDVARRLIGPGLLLLSIGALAALFTARYVGIPLRDLSKMVATAQGTVAELSTQLLTLQEEERRRMARELHDSTVQHLVATNIGLSRLDTEMPQELTQARLIRQEIASEVQAALHELRVFTYLLHPPDLASDGLAATLRQFAAGFGRRSGLDVNLRIPDDVNNAPPPCQLAVLRVVQEALANVHRHADATQVDITARIARGQLFVRIRDDGHGMAGDSPMETIKLGVGIPGMAARLRQFDGNLKIRTGSWGTSVLACVPMGVLV